MTQDLPNICKTCTFYIDNNARSNNETDDSGLDVECRNEQFEIEND